MCTHGRPLCFTQRIQRAGSLPCPASAEHRPDTFDQPRAGDIVTCTFERRCKKNSGDKPCRLFPTMASPTCAYGGPFKIHAGALKPLKQGQRLLHVKIWRRPASRIWARWVVPVYLRPWQFFAPHHLLEKPCWKSVRALPKKSFLPPKLAYAMPWINAAGCLSKGEQLPT